MAEKISAPSGASVLIFGSEKSIHSARAKEIKEILVEWGISAKLFQSPAELKVAIDAKAIDSSSMILVTSEKVTPPLTGWKAVIAKLPRPPRFAVVAEHPVLASLKQDLKPEVLIVGNSPLELLRDFLTERRESTQSQVAQMLSNEGGVELENGARSSLSLLGEAVIADEGPRPLTDTHIDAPEGEALQSLSLENPPSLDLLAVSLTSATPEPASAGTAMEADKDFAKSTPEGLDLDADIAHSMTGGIDNMLPASVGGVDHDALVLNSVPGVSVNGEPGAAADLASELDVLAADSPPARRQSPHQLDPKELAADLAVEASLDESLQAVSTSSAAELPSPKDLSHFDLDAPSGSVSEVSGVPLAVEASDSSTVQVLKKYTALKEKENKEKDSINEALKKQIRQIQEKLKKSDSSRRKLSVEHEETVLRIRTLESQIEQEKNFKAKIEQDHQEQLKDYKLRLENADFNARRLERKLEDYRERIKNDIQQIRQRERELANRLELQKRDAEALIASKDERLLLQKREIDRLEFEIDSLRDRIVDDTQRAEERAQKLIRALQSLKLAQGVLSGIDEEVLPSAGAKSHKSPSNNGNGEAA